LNLPMPFSSTRSRWTS